MLPGFNPLQVVAEAITGGEHPAPAPPEGGQEEFLLQFFAYALRKLLEAKDCAVRARFAK